jgi:hypothetical protein
MLQFSNILQVIIANSLSSGQPFIRSYQVGNRYDLNSSPITESDYTGQNVGRVYPALFNNLHVVATQKNWESRVLSYKVQLIVMDLMAMDNAGNTRTRTPLEVREDLVAIWLRLVLEYNRMKQLCQEQYKADTIPTILNDNIQLTFEDNAFADKVGALIIDFEIQVDYPCTIQPTFDYTTASNNANAPFPIIANFDYTNPFYKNDRNPPV